MAKHSNPARGIYLRNDTYWLTYQKDGKRSRESLQTADFAKAVERAEELRAHPDLQPGDGIQRDIERFFAFKSSHGVFTVASVESKKAVLLKFAEWAGCIPTSSISVKMVQSWYDEMRKGRTESTALSYVMMLSSFFRWAVDDKIVRFNPCRDVKTAKVSPAARPSFCTQKQRDLLIKKCERDDLKFVLYCGFHAGMRFQEIVEAKAFWFDMDAKMIHLRKTDTMQFKDREERSIPMTNAFHGFLEGYGLREPFMLHPEVEKGKSIYRFDFGRAFNSHVTACGLPWVTPHVMRHTFASLLASAGTSIYLISEWMGDDVRVVQRHYARLLPLHDEIERAFTRPGVKTKRKSKTKAKEALPS